MAINEPGATQSPLQQALERFKSLPRNVQLVVIGIFALIVLMILFRSGGNDAPQQQAAPQGNKVSVDLANQQGLTPPNAEGDFQAVGTPEAALRRNFASEVMGQVNELEEKLQQQAEEQNAVFQQRAQELQDLQLQLKESLDAIVSERRSLEESMGRQREELATLAEEARRQARVQQAATGEQPLPVAKQRGPITQIPLGAAIGGGVNPNQALISGATGGVLGGAPDQGQASGGSKGSKSGESATPFIPPLGFIKATLLNGVDALAGGGRATPALARLQGKYKTAMNSTVILDGCFLLIEFEGDISTERARGKPSKMTCVYPDRGAVTYSVSGYAVDAEDGLEGIPGAFYEGDAGRIAAALVAEFTAGLANIVEQNQFTSTVDSEGTERRVLTGDQGKAEVAGAANDATQSLRDYLFARANRVLPFIRIDAQREIHLVLLSGVELRSPEGNAWSAMFDAGSKK